ncbi:MAG: hypothetical protein NTZ43_10965 [Gemmatimonadetes bacterium]|nr:hypothetical protein [Gemmatimonadota bacterium]
MMNLSHTSRHAIGAIALAFVSAPLAAQQAAKVQLAFGYQCDSKFALRNEGAAAVTVEYVVAGTNERGKVTVQPNELVELESATNNDVQLFVQGKLVASEHKGDRSCAAAAGTVTVRHLDPAGTAAQQTVVEQTVVMEPVYVEPRRVVYVRPYDYYDYYRPRVSLNFGFPLFGGHSRMPYYPPPRRGGGGGGGGGGGHHRR